MEFINVTNLKLYFGERIILDIPCLKICKGDKIGIVGMNGSGKSTLLNLLSGELESDQGNVKINASISYYKQFNDENTALKPAETDYIKKMKTFHINAFETEAHSGGEKSRLQLARIFSDQSDIYFLDEPTSNLDYKGILLVKNEIMKMKTFLLVSHDRSLLNECCNKIIEISKGTLSVYEGNYDAYETQKEALHNRKLFEYNQYEKEKKRLLSIYEEKAVKAKKIAKKPKDPGKRVGKECGSKSYSSKAKNAEKAAQAVLKRIDMLEKKEKPRELEKIKIDFRLTNPPQNKNIIQISDLSFGYESKIIFAHLNMIVKNAEKVAILGDNGSGKTTLLNLIVNGHPSIKIVPSVKFGYFRQEFEQLDFSKSVLENAMDDSVQNLCVVRTLLARLLFGEESLNKKVNVLSGGELIRLALLKLIVSGANVLVLDEPTNYLDLASRKAVEDVLQDYMGTIIFVSHDMNFVNTVASQKLIIENKGITDSPLLFCPSRDRLEKL